MMLPERLSYTTTRAFLIVPAMLAGILVFGVVACHRQVPGPSSGTGPQVPLPTVSHPEGWQEQLILTDHQVEIITAITFSADGSHLATASGITYSDFKSDFNREGEVILWNIDTGQAVSNSGVLPHCFEQLAFSPDGETLMSVHEGGEVLVWDVSNRNVRESLTARNVRLAELSKDGRTVVRLYMDGHLGALDTVTMKEQVSANVNFRGASVGRLSAAGDHVVVQARGEDTPGPAELWSVTTGHLQAELGLPDCFVFSHDGDMLAVAGLSGGLNVWQVSPANERIALQEEPNKIEYYRYSALAFTPDGKTLASGYLHVGTVMLWNVISGKSVAGLVDDSRKSVSSLVFSADGRTLAVGSHDGLVKLWRVPVTKASSRAPSSPSEDQPDG